VITELGGTFSVRTNGVDLTPVPSLMFDGRTRLTDEQLARVTQLAEFDRFDPSGDRRNDAEPSYEWTGFSRLKVLGLPGAAITDRGLAHIASANHLEYLDLRGNPITDSGLSKLLTFTPVLKSLRLGLTGVNRNGQDVILKSPDVTDDAFQRIDRLVFLENLELSGLVITDKTLERVGRLRGLKTLNLGGTNITDSGLVHLEPLAQLFLVDLRFTVVTDAGVETVARIAGLRKPEHEVYRKRRTSEIILTGSRVTEAGAARLQTLLPAAKLVFELSPIPR
jgi:Leucine-rich repeat (LRR) protein